MKNNKHNEFLKKLMTRNISAYKELKFIDQFSGSRIKILAMDRYGYVYVTPCYLLCGDGYGIRSAKNKNDYFMSMAKEVHGDKYDYSCIEYINAKIKVKIFCKEHNKYFLQTPHHHLRGSGCQKCSGLYEFSYSTHDIPKYDTFYKIFDKCGIECRHSEKDENVLEIKCYKCNKWHTPLLTEAFVKKNQLVGKRNDGSFNLYCSDLCKSQCIEFNFKSSSIDPRSKLYVGKSKMQEARDCQTDHLKQLQCDEKGYNYCEKCGDIIDIELHHTLEVSKYGKDAVNGSGHILLCAGCHIDIHKDCK